MAVRIVSAGAVKNSFCYDKCAGQDGEWGGAPNCRPPVPTEIEKHTDFLDMMISVVLHDLAFNQNQSVKSANDYYIRILKKKCDKFYR